MILTRANGTPIERPEPLAADATLEEKITWLRAFHAHRDEVADVANEAFVKGFTAALRRDRDAS